jgi:hypothetical protein
MARLRGIELSATYRKLYVAQAGHCNFSSGEVLTALDVLRQRLTTGSWTDLNAGAVNAVTAREGALSPDFEGLSGPRRPAFVDAHLRSLPRISLQGGP